MLIWSDFNTTTIAACGVKKRTEWFKIDVWTKSSLHSIRSDSLLLHSVVCQWDEKIISLPVVAVILRSNPIIAMKLWKLVMQTRKSYTKSSLIAESGSRRISDLCIIIIIMILIFWYDWLDADCSIFLTIPLYPPLSFSHSLRIRVCLHPCICSASFSLSSRAITRIHKHTDTPLIWPDNILIVSLSANARTWHAILHILIEHNILIARDELLRMRMGKKVHT